jgi:signal recognition particle subunit SRP54
MTRNPNQMLSKLTSMIDPKMMAQLGGAGNLMNMMKEMNGNPEMQKMMGGMGMGNLEGLAKKKFVKVKK